MELYYLDELIIITLHVAGFLHPAIFKYFHHNCDKSGLIVTDQTFQSAEYWYYYGTWSEKMCFSMHSDCIKSLKMVFWEEQKSLKSD